MTVQRLSEEWFTRCQERSLSMRRCDKCDVNTFVLRQYCSLCLGELRWCPASDSGEIFTLSLVGKSEATGAGLPAPYVVAYVKIDGALFLTNVRYSTQYPHIGDQVTLDWVVLEDRVVPLFVLST
jgi:uncharacterized OB-fold protein